MNFAVNSLATELTKQLTTLKPQQFTGRLEVKSKTGKQWKIYFGWGEIVWASDACHPYRSWLRHLQQFCPQVKLLEKTFISEAQRFECWKYYVLTVWLKQKNITPEQLKALVENKINEVLFDILQQEANQELSYIWKEESSDFLVASGLKMSLVRVSVEQALRQSIQVWSDWCEKGLEQFSPNFAPFLKEQQQLQQEVGTNIYHNLAKLIHGKHTLRDLAVRMDRDVIRLTCSLIPYLHKGYLELQEIPDLDGRIASFNSSFILETPDLLVAASKPLIACIDDSPQICQIMEQIVTKVDFRYIGIRDPLQAVSTLITFNPNLIFLDVEMPVVNGYEICIQLRRVSKLKETPIVILTGKDSIVDRVRAKMAGSSGFLAKPIEITKIINALEKYLSCNLMAT